MSKKPRRRRRGSGPGRLRRQWYNSPVFRYEERKAYLKEKQKEFVSNVHPKDCFCFTCNPRKAPRVGYPRF